MTESSSNISELLQTLQSETTTKEQKSDAIFQLENLGELGLEGVPVLIQILHKSESKELQVEAAKALSKFARFQKESPLYRQPNRQIQLALIQGSQKEDADLKKVCKEGLEKAYPSEKGSALERMTFGFEGFFKVLRVLLLLFLGLALLGISSCFFLFFSGKFS